MTTVAVLADPPHRDCVLREVSTEAPITDEEGAKLYAALLKDTALAAARSGGDLLVNYRPAEALGLEINSEAAIRECLDGIVNLEETRFEVQVGETFAGRAGNTASHLLETEGIGSVGISRPEAALLARTDIDSAAMKLRSSPVVLSPDPDGRVGYAAFTEPIDFTDCYAPPAVATLTDRAIDADLTVDFLEMKPFIVDASDLARVVVAVRARRRSGAIVPSHLAAWIEEVGLSVIDDSGELLLER